ncbi:TnsD family Tn7-like transposition protein [Pseudomonas sp. NY15435]|uniref:TnsD family Tn7-like transposition protein n=1 Tax=Pseudomonas sp. NY15435 TaxID=3400358 RepID=UPI003A8A900F
MHPPPNKETANLSAVTLRWLEDETFFSLCSRLHVIWGNIKTAATSRMLFGSAGITIAHDFPHSLDTLPCNISSALGDSDSIICRHTILPLFFPFQSKEHVQAVMAAVKGPQLGSIKYRLGLLTGRFGAEHPLKACSACMEADAGAHGVAYWHLAHQYPGVIVCPTHKLRLQESTRNREWSGRFQWALPEKTMLTSWPDAVESIAQQALLQFATSILDLAAVGTCKSFDPLVVTSVYRNALREMGFRNSVSQKAAPALAEYAALLQPYHPLTSLPNTAQKACSYIGQLIRSPHGHSHPLKHLVMITWLFGQVSSFIEAYDREEACWERATSPPTEALDRNRPLARLTESDSASPRMLRPKVLKYPVRAEILKLLGQGVPKDDVCAQFKITISTVNKLLRAEPAIKQAWVEATLRKRLLEHRNDWMSLIDRHPDSSTKVIRTENPKLYAWLYRNDKAWLLQETTRLPTGRIGNNSNIDWELRDQALEATIFAALQQTLFCDKNSERGIKDIFTLSPTLSSCLQKRDQYPRTRALLHKIKQRR